MKINWYGLITPTLIGVFWGCFFTFGWFKTIVWSIVISAIIGLILRLYENNRGVL